jgi:Tfp pilus assembly protein PilV
MSSEVEAAKRHLGDGGFTLVEVIVSTIFLTVAMVAILQCLAHVLQMQVESRKQWTRSLEKWNRCQELRSGLEAGEPVSVLPSARSLFRFVVQADDGDLLSWEVLRAPK